MCGYDEQLVMILTFPNPESSINRSTSNHKLSTSTSAGTSLDVTRTTILVLRTPILVLPHREGKNKHTAVFASSHFVR